MTNKSSNYVPVDGLKMDGMDVDKEVNCTTTISNDFTIIPLELAEYKIDYKPYSIKINFVPLYDTIIIWDVNIYKEFIKEFIEYSKRQKLIEVFENREKKYRKMIDEFLKVRKQS